MAGYELVGVKTDARGNIDLDDLRGKVDGETAALMLTNPSTLGLFDEGIEEIERIFHGAGALMYYDGANLNAVCGIARPGDMGFDVVHINLHKTFSQPHGGGGPGGGPIAVRDILEPFLPSPQVVRLDDGSFGLDDDRPKTIGRVRGFTGPFGVFVRSYAYIRAYGPELKGMSETAVLNANYLLALLKGAYELPYDRLCMHEFVLSARSLKREHGVTALDVAKRLMDYGFHPPTIYFPLVVPEALMIEPTETEAKETLDAFADAMLAIAREAAEEPGAGEGGAAHAARCGRLDEVKAVKQLVRQVRLRRAAGRGPGVIGETAHAASRQGDPRTRRQLGASTTSCGVTACASAPRASSPARRSTSSCPCCAGSNEQGLLTNTTLLGEGVHDPPTRAGRSSTRTARCSTGSRPRG